MQMEHGLWPVARMSGCPENFISAPCLACNDFIPIPAAPPPVPATLHYPLQAWPLVRKKLAQDLTNHQKEKKRKEKLHKQQNHQYRMHKNLSRQLKQSIDRRHRRQCFVTHNQQP